jgi:hypothetical protein
MSLVLGRLPSMQWGRLQAPRRLRLLEPLSPNPWGRLQAPAVPSALQKEIP